MYFAAKMAAKSLTKQIHTEAQKSKFEPWTWLEKKLWRREVWNVCILCILCVQYTHQTILEYSIPELRRVTVDIVKDLNLESLQDLQPPSLLAHQVQGAECERDPDVPEKNLFFNLSKPSNLHRKIPHTESLLEVPINSGQLGHTGIYSFIWL